MQRIVLAVPGDIGGCGPLGLGLMQTWRGGGKVTSWMDGVGEDEMYWTNEVDETNMWQFC